MRPAEAVRTCDECSTLFYADYGAQAGKCLICGYPGVSDAYYCKECVSQEKDVHLANVERRLPQNHQSRLGKDRHDIRKEKVWGVPRILNVLHEEIVLCLLNSNTGLGSRRVESQRESLLFDLA